MSSFGANPIIIFHIVSLAFLMPSLKLAEAAQSDIFAKVDGTSAFSKNLLPELSTNDSISQITDMAQGFDGSIFLGGIIEATDSDSNKQTFVQDESDDRLGEQDMFIIKLSTNGRFSWGKRFGSRGTDNLRALTVDDSNNVYIAGSIGRTMGDNSTGEVVIKYGTNGSRIWVKGFGSGVGGEILNALVMNDDSSEVIAAGTIGAQSNLHTDSSRVSVSAAMIVRMASQDGANKGIAVGKLIESETGVTGSGLAVSTVNGVGSCYVVGQSQKTSGTTKMYNSAVYSFAYPNLTGIARREISTQTDDGFTKAALSNNKQSVFAVGTEYVSTYAEADLTVTSFQTGDLSKRWGRSVGSEAFSDQASIVEGGKSEKGRDIGVDEFGNVYVLAEASAEIVKSSTQSALRNKRPLLLVYGPDGSEVHRAQSETISATGGVRMIVGERRVIAAGWTLDKTSLMNKAWVSGVEIPESVYKKNADERVTEETAQETAEEESSNDDGEIVPFDSGVNVGLIAGAAGGAVAVALIAIIVGVVVATRRSEGAAPPPPPA